MRLPPLIVARHPGGKPHVPRIDILETSADLKVLERGLDGLFSLGTRLYVLGSAAPRGSRLIQNAHPYLIEINRQTKLYAFLGIRSGLHAFIVDRVDSACDIKISAEIGMRLSIFAGAGGKALLSSLADEEIDRLLAAAHLKPYTANTITDKARFRKAVLRSRREEIAHDREVYIQGIVALAIPLKIRKDDLQAAVWALGLSQQLSEEKVPVFTTLLKKFAADHPDCSG